MASSHPPTQRQSLQHAFGRAFSVFACHQQHAAAAASAATNPNGAEDLAIQYSESFHEGTSARTPHRSTSKTFNLSNSFIHANLWKRASKQKTKGNALTAASSKSLTLGEAPAASGGRSSSAQHGRKLEKALHSEEARSRGRTQHHSDSDGRQENGIDKEEIGRSSLRLNDAQLGLNDLLQRISHRTGPSSSSMKHSQGNNSPFHPAAASNALLLHRLEEAEKAAQAIITRCRHQEDALIRRAKQSAEEEIAGYRQTYAGNVLQEEKRMQSEARQTEDLLEESWAKEAEALKTATNRRSACRQQTVEFITDKVLHVELGIFGTARWALADSDAVHHGTGSLSLTRTTC